MVNKKILKKSSNKISITPKENRFAITLRQQISFRKRYYFKYK